MSDIIVGIDNGVSGTISILGKDEPRFFKTPFKEEQDFTKTSKIVKRLDAPAFKSILIDYALSPGKRTLVIMERPFINPKMFTTSICAARCWEAQLCMLEVLDIPRVFKDSKEWQKAMLPAISEKPKKEMDKAARAKYNRDRKKALKIASRDRGIQLFPELEELIMAHEDADSLLMAEFYRRQNY